MIMKELTAGDRAYFYTTYLINDFRKGELKPFEFIEDLVNRGLYLCYGFYDNNEILGYAYFVKTDKGRALLGEYFAVVKHLRSKGLGTLLLAEMKNHFLDKYNVMIIEVENPEYAIDDTNRNLRERRLDFYLRNGFYKTNMLSRIVAEEYLIMTLELRRQLHNLRLNISLRYIYRNIYGWKFMLKNIAIRTTKAEVSLIGGKG